VPGPSAAACRLRAKEAALLDPLTRMALAASALALDDAGLTAVGTDDRRNTYSIPEIDRSRFGVVVGTGIGGLSTVEASHARHARGEKLRGALRYALPMLIPNAVPAQIAIKYRLGGECKVIGTACAAGTMAIGDAFRLIRDGELDAVLAGGADRLLSTTDGYAFMGFDLLNTMSSRNDDPERACRPFDAGRDGFVMGDGAAMLVLEREDHARARGARVWARVLGYGTTCDAHSMMQLEPSGDAIVRCMERAIRSADVATSDVGYVNAHGTATRVNDPAECQAIRRVLGSAVGDVQVNSTKSMTGHTIGASGGIEAIVTSLTLATGTVHACVNLEDRDPECDVPLPTTNVEAGPTVALSNSFGFGGHNATLVLGVA
jgi:3-oxoacyl-[acyl-carrier-protein] synthase II